MVLIESTRSLKSLDFAIHNAARDVLADAAIGGGAHSSCVEPDGWWSDERFPEMPVTPDFGASRGGAVTGYDVHCHGAVTHASSPKSLLQRGFSADRAKSNGHGRVETYRSKRDAAVSARYLTTSCVNNIKSTLHLMSSTDQSDPYQHLYADIIDGRLYSPRLDSLHGCP